jgi:hypothetical protein
MLHPPPSAPSSSSAYNFSSSSSSPLYAFDGLGGGGQQQQQHSNHNHGGGGGGGVGLNNHAPAYQHSIGGGLLAPHDGSGNNKRLRSGGATGTSPYGSPPSSPGGGNGGGGGGMGGGMGGGLYSHQHHAETTRDSMAKLAKQAGDHLTSLVAVRLLACFSLRAFLLVRERERERS